MNNAIPDNILWITYRPAMARFIGSSSVILFLLLKEPVSEDVILEVRSE
jgi:hypothetical protein